jgi:Uma2 family endonuclease
VHFKNKHIDYGFENKTPYICPMNATIEKILTQPNAPLILKELSERMTTEHSRRLEFYAWVDENNKAEFINGQIIIHSPVKRKHWKVTDLFSSVLSIYTRIKNLGVVGTEKVMIALTRNDYEPDIVFFKTEKAAKFTEDQVLFPAPDFIVEILSKKTGKIDKTTKKDDYAAHGVQEYWIIDPNKQIIEQYLLLKPTDTTYFEPYKYQIGEEITSKVIEGFTIPVAAIFDEKENVKALQALIGQ